MSSLDASRFRAPTRGKLGLLLAATVVSIGAVEVALRSFPGLVEPPRPAVTRFDPVLGWSLVPDTIVTIRSSEFVATERTNHLGLRGPDVPDEKPFGEYRVLLLGDSFVEGYTVDQEQTADRVMERELRDAGVRVINAGTRGWSTDQELLFFRRTGASLDPDLTVLAFFINDVCMNSAERYWRGRKPRFVARNEEVELRPVPLSASMDGKGGLGLGAAIRDLVAGSATYRLAVAAIDGLMNRVTSRQVPAQRAPWLLSDDGHPCLAEGWDLTGRLIEQLRREVEEAGGALLVFWVPTREAVYPESWERTRRAYAVAPEALSPTAEAEKLRSLCDARGLDCLIPLDAFRSAAGSSGEPLYYEEDPHWTPAGHALAGRLLAGWVRERLAGRERPGERPQEP